jgi:phospholysine phosphohistidine inorganic pyrophosphate phosphatase
MASVEGYLIDLDGTVYEAGQAIAGAAGTMSWLRDAGIPHLFTTNTSRMSRRAVVKQLSSIGLEVEATAILTAPSAAAGWLRREGIERVMLLLPESTHEDFAEFDRVGPDAAPGAVVVGDLGRGFTFDRLNAAFRVLRAGARLVAVHKNRFWLPEAGPTLDAGPFVVGLEYAAGVEAVLVGKPAPAFFELAAEMLELPAERLAVVGDDAESDIRGARAAGLTAIQVKTGKYDPDRAVSGGPDEQPHYRIESISGLPALTLDHEGGSGG